MKAPIAAVTPDAGSTASRRPSRGRGARHLAVLVGCTFGLAAVPATAGANALAVQNWTPQTTNYIEQTIQPEASEPDTFFALQGVTTSPGTAESPPVMTAGLQNAGGSKVAVFHMYNANGAYGEHCSDFHSGGDGSYCWMPFEYSDHRQYRVRMQRKQSDAGGTWWEATVVDSSGRSTYIAALRQPGAPGSIARSASFVQYYGPDGCFTPARAFFLPPRSVDAGTSSQIADRWDFGSCVSPKYDEGYGGVSVTIGPGTPKPTNKAALVLDWAYSHLTWWDGLYSAAHPLSVTRSVEYMQHNEPPMGRTSNGKIQQGCDCSSFVRWAFAQAGIDAGTYTLTMWTKFGPANTSSKEVDLPTGHASRGWGKGSSPPGGWRPGDLAFYGVSSFQGVPAGKGHVVIYAGDGKVVQCSSKLGSNERPFRQDRVTGWIRYDSVSG